jgi:hypothetical protein
MIQAKKFVNSDNMKYTLLVTCLLLQLLAYPQMDNIEVVLESDPSLKEQTMFHFVDPRRDFVEIIFQYDEYRQCDTIFVKSFDTTTVIVCDKFATRGHISTKSVKLIKEKNCNSLIKVCLNYDKCFEFFLYPDKSIVYVDFRKQPIQVTYTNLKRRNE